MEERGSVLRAVHLPLQLPHHAARDPQLVARELRRERGAERLARDADVLAVEAEGGEAALALVVGRADGLHHLAEPVVLQQPRSILAEPVDELLPLDGLEVAREERAEVVRYGGELEDAAVPLVPHVEGALHLLLRLAFAQQVRAEQRADDLLHLALLEAALAQLLREAAGPLQRLRLELHRDADIEQAHRRRPELERLRRVREAAQEATTHPTTHHFGLNAHARLSR